MVSNKIKGVIIIFFVAFAFLSSKAFCDTDGHLNSQKNQIEAKRTKAKQEIKKLKLLEKIETNKLYKNQQKLEYAQHDLEQSQQKRKNAENEINDLEKKLNVLLAKYEKHQQYTSKRLVQMFKHKRNSYIEFLLNSNDINAFLDRLYFENIIISYDRKKLREAKITAREMLSLKSKLEQQKESLKVSIKRINRQQEDIQVAIQKNKKLIEKLETDRATWEKAERDLAKQSKAIAQMINQEVKRSEKSGHSISVTSAFARPISGKITSPFGWRMHPIFKRKIFHSGVDIGAPYGTPIKAANSGRVIFVGWYSGYGKVVIIDHGIIDNVPTTTLYAHMSVTLAKQGQNVSKGTVIGKVGTTGYSTGPHLHFEVRQKGNPVNPLNFIR